MPAHELILDLAIRCGFPVLGGRNATAIPG